MMMSLILKLQIMINVLIKNELMMQIIRNVFTRQVAGTQSLIKLSVSFVLFNFISK